MWFRHRLSRKLFGLLWAGTAAVVITLALLVSTARLLLPLLDDYRIQIEQVASSQVGRPVQIGEITAGWHGLEPDLRLRDVRILSADGSTTWLSMSEVRASLDVIASIRRRRLETGSISLVGGSLDVVRHDDGSFSVAGVSTGFGGVAGHGGRGLLQWLMARDHVLLEGATLRWHDSRMSRRPLEISQLRLDLRQVDGDYRLGGAGQLAATPGSTLRFALLLSGDPERPKTLHSSLYLEGRLLLGDWLDGSMFAGVEQLGGALEFQLWADGADRLEQLRGKIQGRELLWQPRLGPQFDSPVAAVRFDQAQGTLFWQRRNGGWRLGLEQVQIVRDHRQWPETGLQLALSHNPSREDVWELSTPFARLEDINAVLVTLPFLPLELRTAAAALSPRGDLRSVALRYDPAQIQGGLYAQAQFQDFSVGPWLRIPGVEGADGTVRLNDRRGLLELQSRGVEFIYPRLFRQPLHADSLAGRVFWFPGPEGVRLYAPHFSARNDDVQAEGRAQMDLPDSAGSPFLDLTVAFRDAMVGQAPRYLPVGIMPDKVVNWVDHALASGRARQGRALFFGRLKDFPFNSAEGSFRVDFGVEDLILDYESEWPRLEEAEAGIRFSDRSMHADVYSGKLLGLEVGRSEVRIADMGRDGALVLDAQARGPLQSFIAYLRRGPLKNSPPAALDQLQVGNGARGRVFLRLPFDRPESTQVQGALDFSGNSLAWPTWDVRLELLQGELKFAVRDKAVTYRADDLKLRWRGAPATATIRTSALGDESQVRIDLQTRNDVAALLGSRAPDVQNLLRGSAQWNLRATVHQPKQVDAPATVDVQVESDLAGVAVTLPEPLQKTEVEKRSVLLQANLGEQGVRRVRFYYGSLFNGVFALESGRLQRGELRLGPAQANLPSESGLRLAGATEQLSISQWRHWLDASGQRAGGEGLADQVNVIDLQVGELEVMGHVLHELHLQAHKSDQAWLAQVAADEVEGSVQYSMAGDQAAPFTAKLKRLQLAAASTPDENPDSAAVDATVLPPLRIDVERFIYGATELGTLALVADPIAEGLRITRARIDGPNFQANASGEWFEAPRGQLSKFVIDADTDSLGRALEQFGYSGTIEGGQASFHIEAQWPGSPAAFALKNLDGNVRLTLSDGQLLALDPRGGRIFGLLSLQALPRRLSLDFSDLFRRGFAFDRIQGSFTIADGDAYTNDLYMEGPAARVDVAGRIGLVAEDYDQTALVTPRISASIPVVGGLAGGPAVGLGLWVAERMFGKKIDELSRVRYNITGSWRDPAVTRVEEGG